MSIFLCVCLSIWIVNSLNSQIFFISTCFIPWSNVSCDSSIKPLSTLGTIALSHLSFVPFHTSEHKHLHSHICLPFCIHVHLSSSPSYSIQDYPFYITCQYCEWDAQLPILRGVRVDGSSWRGHTALLEKCFLFPAPTRLAHGHL